ncbi:hypothetical protein [Aureimonas sp. AU22]|jgi:hypothetical protein|uniref:hypothetical protein n=1 Tax=Aureimonas sp. AU22 TaxID=1638162 RepID=UPI0007846C8C|nr:hypothetical protein [Aureimonas sp. AU22]
MFYLDEDDTRVSAARKRSYMIDAITRWPWLTPVDCLNCETDEQFVSAVQRGSRGSAVEIAAEVALWMRGKTF